MTKIIPCISIEGTFHLDSKIIDIELDWLGFEISEDKKHLMIREYAEQYYSIQLNKHGLQALIEALQELCNKME
jgi:hypothetical protein